jgi:hypothetical protein
MAKVWTMSDRPPSLPDILIGNLAIPWVYRLLSEPVFDAANAT